MNLAKLIAKGRVQPVYEMRIAPGDSHPTRWLVAWERKPGSRKTRRGVPERYHLTHPRKSAYQPEQVAGDNGKVPEQFARDGMVGMEYDGHTADKPTKETP